MLGGLGTPLNPALIKACCSGCVSCDRTCGRVACYAVARKFIDRGKLSVGFVELSITELSASEFAASSGDGDRQKLLSTAESAVGDGDSSAIDSCPRQGVTCLYSAAVCLHVAQ